MKLDIRDGNELLKSFPLQAGKFRVGKHVKSELRLDFPTVSKQHFSIEVENDQVWIQDLASKNGTFLNSEKLVPYEKARLQQADTIRVGPFTLKLNSNDSQPHSLEILSSRYHEILEQDPNATLEKLRSTHKITENHLETLYHEFHGDGPVSKWLLNEKCKEVLINSFDQIFIDIGTGLMRAKESFLSKESYEAWVFRLVQNLGKRLDLQNPICEATLEDGSRLHAVLSPIASPSLSIAIRRFKSAPLTETEALESGWMTKESLSLLKVCVNRKLNCVISGGTSTGKTSLLNFLCQYLEKNERVLTIEDTIELSPPIENLVQLQARKANSDGIGEVTLRSLIQCALRMRPDRIVVGECRGDEVLEMLQALNTGHPGSLTTLHSNSIDEALKRLELLCLLGSTNLSTEAVRNWILGCVDVIIQVERDLKGRRFIKEIAVNENKRETLHEFFFNERRGAFHVLRV